ncbi:NAD(P)H-quinone oxidoreductase subunit U, chloroplastic isoform X2 [Cryptomeria japonica]|uniref:NAD(P)H-quinone oxidoreductase subunit U, chloroplastic isoform X2 n=1 Tax=Cryptomeria japonica TaxID=3369 RepID=UPI0025ABDE0F|nr:NAD(P)H-quinone oxidoreductase subunit U, chloroplastic isoform X2 [Cryptomeria japonica]
MACVITGSAFAGTSILSIVAKFNHTQLRTTKCLSARRRQRLSVSNTVENIPESSSSSEVADKDSSSSVLTPRSFTSLITSSNIRKALEGIECVSVDHYARLGIPRGCSFAEVREAFRRKCEDLTQQELDEEKVQSKIQDLKESYEILSSEEERRFYDWSLARVENQERYVWPYEVDITQRSSEPGPTQATSDISFGGILTINCRS